MSSPDFDIVIVGAGIAGAALVRALEGASLRLALVEARELPGTPERPGVITGPEDFDSRVSAITPASRAFLDKLGAWSQLPAERVCPYRSMKVWDADGTGEIDFEAADLDVPALGHIVENRALTAALLTGVEKRADVTVFTPARLAGVDLSARGGVRLGLEDGRDVSSRLLVAADGALSKVRQLADFRTREWDYGHRALVTTAETGRAHGATAWQRFLGSGPLAYLPLPESGGRHYCSIVWSAEPGLADDLEAMDDAAFRSALGAALEFRLGEVLSCSPRACFPLRQRHAIDYVKPGVALVGDAAHTIHPLAGQGINLGLQDVAALADELLSGAARGDDLGGYPLLKRYQRRRKGENLLMMAAMEGFKTLFGARQMPVRWLRNQGLKWVDRSGPLKHQMMRHAMGVR